MENERNLHEINQYMDDAFPVGIYNILQQIYQKMANISASSFVLAVV